MEFRLANISDLDNLKKFYDDIIDGHVDDDYSAKWTKDVYPSRNDILSHIENNEMFIGLIGDEIAAAGAISFKEDPMYHCDKWKLKLSDDEVGVLHIFAVSKKFRRSGISTMMLQYLIEQIKAHGLKAIHLDTYINNVPAERLYKKNGFEYRGLLNVYYEDTGNIDVELFECII